MGAVPRMLRFARLEAGLSQRELAERVGVPQPTVARIESGAVTPRVDTLSKLLRGCGYTLEVEPLPGDDVDRTVIEEMRKLTPAERLETGKRWANFLAGARMEEDI